MSMYLRCGILLLCLNCVRTAEDYGYGLKDPFYDVNERYSLWPSVHNAAKVMRVRRQTKDAPVGHSEGGILENNNQLPPSIQLLPDDLPEKPVETNKTPDTKEAVVVKDAKPETPALPKVASTSPPVVTADNTTASPVVLTSNVTKVNETTTNLDLNNPGVLKRALIVFGGFSIMALAYFIFYKRKTKNNEANSSTTIDANQFRYGVLMNEDRRDNMELSRVPLTMESDEDEDEDLEIFDLEQKKKSLSYVNLQTNDEDIVLDRSRNSIDRDELLLDIDDRDSDILINWTNGNKTLL